MQSVEDLQVAVRTARQKMFPDFMDYIENTPEEFIVTVHGKVDNIVPVSVLHKPTNNEVYSGIHQSEHQNQVEAEFMLAKNLIWRNAVNSRITLERTDGWKQQIPT